MPTKIKLSGVTMAAKEAGVSRQHLRLCALGARTPSRKVLRAIRKNVFFYTIATNPNHAKDNC